MFGGCIDARHVGYICRFMSHTTSETGTIKMISNFVPRTHVVVEQRFEVAVSHKMRRFIPVREVNAGFYALAVQPITLHVLSHVFVFARRIGAN